MANLGEKLKVNLMKSKNYSNIYFKDHEIDEMILHADTNGVGKHRQSVLKPFIG